MKAQLKEIVQEFIQKEIGAEAQVVEAQWIKKLTKQEHGQSKNKQLETEKIMDKKSRLKKRQSFIGNDLIQKEGQI